MSRAAGRWARAGLLLVGLGLGGWGELSGSGAWAVAARPAQPGAEARLLDFSADERARILRHGPWPPAPALDPGNPLAGRPAAIALGQALFFDARLSPDGRLACASCHLPALAFTDGRARGEGRSPLDRNTPSLWNAVHQRWLGWDGAFDSLWSQALHPLLSPQEMAGSAAHLQALLASDKALSCAWRRGTGGPTPSAADPAEASLVELAQALGSFVATLVSGHTPFDHFRDALAQGNTRQASAYSLAAQRGLRLFIGRGKCSTCHVGPLFSNGEFADIGAAHFVRPGVVDAGRHGGIQALLASPYNLLGPWARPSDPAAPDDPARKTRHVLAQHRNFGEFKVPSLRNVADTAPYLHDGQLATLDAVVRHYSQLNLDRLHADGEQILQPLNLTEAESADLVAFLRSLSDPQAGRWQARPLTENGPTASTPPPTRQPSRHSRHPLPTALKSRPPCD